MIIKSHFKDYNISFPDSLDVLSGYKEEDNSFFVIDQKVYDLYKESFEGIREDRLRFIEALEVNKTIETALEICEQMTAMPSKRNTHLISVGGGIIQDITGFVANVLYRGIEWTFFPSTLLAACDSCIGGKTSLNYKGFKNLIGTFYPPDNIGIYTRFFETLSDKDYYSGLGEVIKFNVMAGRSGIDRIEKDLPEILKRDPDILSRYVKTSLEFKKTFIEEDEFDKGIRILLNYAHTFGHAFEVSSSYEIPHGTAVALGMITANRISVSRGILDGGFAKRIEDVCRSIIPEYVRSGRFDPDTILNAIKKDKKQISDKAYRAILMKEDLSLELFDDVTEGEIRSGVNYLVDEFIQKL